MDINRADDPKSGPNSVAQISDRMDWVDDEETEAKRKRVRSSYWEHGDNSDGIPYPHGSCGLVGFKCNDRFPCSGLLILYAKMGLHRYNMLQGTNFQFRRVKKYNQTTAAAACGYYITLVANDPTTSTRQIFQTKVDEHFYGKFILTCPTTRPRGQTNTNPVSAVPDYVPEEWPLQDPFQNTNLFHVVKESQNNNWIRLCLELAVATTDKSTKDHHLSYLDILKAAIKTSHVDPLKALNATLYISYKDPCEARVTKDGMGVDRVAIIKSNFDEHTGCFSLVGQTQAYQKSAPLSSPQAMAIPQAGADI